jgi:hypothetical protein
MEKIYDLAVKVGTYEKNGETKGRYENVGSVMKDNDGGKFILLNRTFNPAGVPNPDNKSSVLISLFKPKAKDDSDAPAAPVSDDDIPF